LTRSSTIAETARVTTSDRGDHEYMTCVNFISLTELLMRGILHPVTLCQQTRQTVSKSDLTASNQ